MDTLYIHTNTIKRESLWDFSKFLPLESLFSAKEVVVEPKVKWALNSFSPYKSAETDRIYPILLQKGAKLVVPH